MTKLQPPANRDWMSEEECPIPELHSKTPSQQNKSQQQQKQTHSVTMLSLSQGLGLHQNQKLPTQVLRKTETTALWDTLTEKAIVESTESELSKNNKECPSWLQMPRQLHRIGREKKKLRKIFWGDGEMAQWEKCLPHKHKEVNSSPQAGARRGSVPLQSQHRGRRGRGSLGLIAQTV